MAMQKGFAPILIVLMIVVIVIVAGVLFWLSQKEVKPPGEVITKLEVDLPGITLEEARQIVPFIQKISLTAETTPDGVLLQWTAVKKITVNYYDIYRRTPGSTGWGELIERVEVRNDYSGPYQYVDKRGIDGRYLYQIIGVRLSGIYEIKEEASNIVEVTL